MSNNKNLEFGALKIFATVAESQTLTQAAERLGITQSAVSQAIKQLEKQTQSTLVMRKNRPIKLSPSGQVLYRYSEKLFSETQRMLIDVRTAAKGSVANLNVGMIDSFCDVSGQRFVEFIKPFATKMILRTGLVSPLSQALLDRELDILITSDPMPNRPELDYHPILRDPFVMVIAEDMCPHEPTLSYIAANTPFIQYDVDTRLGIATNIIARRLRIELNTRYEVDNTQALLRFVQAGFGWAILPGLCLVGCAELLSGIRVLNIDNGINARYISLLSRKHELGELPSETADICRSIYTEDVIPRLLTFAPWLEGHARAVNEAPTI